jgi:hypothetical protein
MHLPLLGVVWAQAVLEPPVGKKLLAISLVNELEPVGRDPWRPVEPFVSFNERTGFNWSAYHLVQEIPRKIYPPFEYMDHTRTDTALYLTVLPATGWSAITESDLDELVKLCEDMNMRGRSVFLRFAPEFNCPWHIWGMQPIRFKRTWSQLYIKLREKPMANRTALVWSAFEGNSYPFGDYDFSPRNSTDEFLALDSNRDGILDGRDDPYWPYFPNETASVDWVGLSVFWRGNDVPPRNNSRPPENYISRIISGVNTTNFYAEFATRLGKPMMIAESAAFFFRRAATNQTALPGVSELDMKRTWWNQLLNIPKEFPSIKMITFTESRLVGFERDSNVTLDARVTINRTILEAFQYSIRSIESAVIWSSNAAIESWPTNVTTDLPTPRSDHSNFQNLTLLFLFPIPLVGFLIWLGVASYRRMRRNDAIDPLGDEAKSHEPDPVDDCSTIFGSEIDSQMTTSDDGLAFEDEPYPEAEPVLLDRIVVSPRIRSETIE